MRYAHRSNLERQRFEIVWWVPRDEAPAFGGALIRSIDQYPTLQIGEEVEQNPGRRTMRKLSRAVNGFADKVERGQTRSEELTLILCDRSFTAALFAVKVGGLFVEEVEHVFGRVIPLHVIDCGTADGVHSNDGGGSPGGALITSGFTSALDAQKMRVAATGTDGQSVL